MILFSRTVLRYFTFVQFSSIKIVSIALFFNTLFFGCGFLHASTISVDIPKESGSNDRTIKISAPQKDAILPAGAKKVEVKWTPTNTSGKFVIAYWNPAIKPNPDYENIRAGQGCGGIISGKNGEEISCKWDVPDTFIPSDKITIRITDNGNGDIEGISKPFTITKIEVTQPKGGENFTVGKTKEIKWNAPHIDGNVKIEYSTKGFVNPNDINVIIESIAANSGVYKWVLPDDASATARVRITSLKHSFLKEESVKDFSIKDPLRIHFINIGSGSCTLIECPGVKAPPMFVDCGTRSGRVGRDGLANTPLIEGKTESEVRDYVVNRIKKSGDQNYTSPNMVISHADKDHYNKFVHSDKNGAFTELLLSGHTVDHVWLGMKQDNYNGKRYDLNKWLTKYKNHSSPPPNVNIVHENLGKDFNNDAQPIADLNCGDATTYILTANTPTSANAQSLVLLIKYGQFSAIFPGDAEGVTELKALASINEVKNNNTSDPSYAKALDNITVLSGSHHGADTHNSNSVIWAKTTKPRMLVFSSGETDQHPRCTAISEFYEEYIKTSGAVVPAHQVICGSQKPVRNPPRQLLSVAPVHLATPFVKTLTSKWKGHNTTLPIYTTADSGTIAIEVTADYTQQDALDGTKDTFQMAFDPLWPKTTSPQKGDIFSVGQTRDITWTSGYPIRNPTRKVKIEYSKDGFNSDVNVISGSVTVNLGKHLWKIPNDVSTNVQIRITDVANPNVVNVSNIFTIQ